MGEYYILFSSMVYVHARGRDKRKKPAKSTVFR